MNKVVDNKEGFNLAETGFVKVEILQASNTKVLAINDTRVSLEKGYGIMKPIASFEVGVEDILNAMNYKPMVVNDAPTIKSELDEDWISVKDRLPEPRTWVMVYIKYPSPVFEIERGIHKTGNIKKMFYDGFRKDKFVYGSGTITHWQPLPEPPKGE